MRWSLRGTAQQNAIIQQALDRCDFPFETFGEDRTIPVEWADLSRYSAAPVGGDSPLEAHAAPGASADHDHDGEFDVLAISAELAEELGFPAEEERPRAHGDDDHHEGAARERVLGLAWYSGRVTLEQTLVAQPTLAMEVFLSEGAHMVDFFGMTDDHRVGVWNAVHPPHQHLAPGTNIADGMDLGHGHSWFDVGGYYSWVGEAFMGLFVRAFSNIPVTINFNHAATTEASAKVRDIFLPAVEDIPEPEPEPTPPTPEPVPEPVPEPEPGPYFGITGSSVYHDSHRGIRRDVEFTSKEHAERAWNRRPCKTCKPS